jgi:hypothetical protein
MSGPNDLEDLLNSSEGEPAAHQPQQETVEQSEPAPEQTGEKQQSAAPPADAQPVVEDAGSWTKQAVLDERRKRQELEKKVAEYEAKLRQPQQPQQQQEQPDWFASPEQAAQAMQAQFAQSMFETRVATSERILKKEHADYDEVSNLFAERAKHDPHLLQQLYQHPFPAEFAYEVGQQIKLFEEIKDPKAYREKVRAELLAEMQPGDQRSQAPATSKPAVPRSLARDVSTQPRTQTGQFTGPTPLDELLG